MSDPYTDLVGWVQERAAEGGYPIERHQALILAESLHRSAIAGADFEASLNLVEEVTRTPREETQRQYDEFVRWLTEAQLHPTDAPHAAPESR